MCYHNFMGCQQKIFCCEITIAVVPPNSANDELNIFSLFNFRFYSFSSVVFIIPRRSLRHAKNKKKFSNKHSLQLLLLLVV